jgi:L-amino acid N-acyltransferase YncA
LIEGLAWSGLVFFGGARRIRSIMSMTIRVASVDDAAQCLEIYAPFCLETPVSFETEAPSLEEMRQRIAKTLEFFPWLVAEDETGRVLGYAYASRHRERAGYRWAADVSVYVREGERGKGLGRALYTSLFAILRLQGIYTVLAGITLPNRASVVLHEAMGLRPLGVYTGIGYKCDAWHDVGWWQCALQSQDGPPAEPIAFPAIRETAACASAVQWGVASD